MDRIIIKVPGAPVREVELPPGVHKVGRSINTDLQIDHPSVSSSHCEISVNDGAVTVKDLGSTNGTFLDGQPVQECQIVPGQVLRMGEAELHFTPEAVLKPGLKLAAVPAVDEPVAVPVPLAPPIPPSRHQARPVPPRPLRRPKNFYKSIPGAFVYPFKRNGLLLLLSGTIIFGIFDYVFSLRVNGIRMAGMVGVVFSSCLTGYLFLYMQTIITTTALGDDDMPPWPVYESWWESLAEPYFRLIGVCAACIAPAFLCLIFAGHAGRWLYFPLLVVGFCYAPMAFLAVAMDDSLLGLNPMLVVPSILRVPLEYLASCMMVGLLLCLLGLRSLLTAVLDQPLLSQILGMFLVLYFTVVEMRLLGLLYYTKKDRLGWRA
jgi:pSer/pThr/pTyr-binding forkhead associated (FHA) protein